MEQITEAKAPDMSQVHKLTAERETMKGIMKLQTVPDFFQEETEEALRSQVEWLGEEAGVDHALFARFLAWFKTSVFRVTTRILSVPPRPSCSRSRRASRAQDRWKRV